MKRPRILLTTASSPSHSGLDRIDSLTGLNYCEAIVQAGGLPLLASNLQPDLAESFLEGIDGLLLTGGADIDPYFYGQQPHAGLGKVDSERDEFELALYKAAKARNLPVLGVCRGIQLINVAEGGTLHQHLPALTNTIQHVQENRGSALAHELRLEPQSKLAKAVGSNKMRSNSFHHQAIDSLGAKLRVSAKTSDGIIEAVEGRSEQFVLAVQWHPEMSFKAHPEQHLPFQIFLEAVKTQTFGVKS